jgi:hypothetical protein
VNRGPSWILMMRKTVGKKSGATVPSNNDPNGEIWYGYYLTFII